MVHVEKQRVKSSHVEALHRVAQNSLWLVVSIHRNIFNFIYLFLFSRIFVVFVRGQLIKIVHLNIYQNLRHRL